MTPTSLLFSRVATRPEPVSPTTERARLQGAIRDLEKWGDQHPDLLKRLDEVLQALPEITAT